MNKGLDLLHSWAPASTGASMGAFLVRVIFVNMVGVIGFALLNSNKVNNSKKKHDIDVDTGADLNKRFSFTKGEETADVAVSSLNSSKNNDHVLKREKIRRADVVLVGAGPGDRELLTIAAYRVLQEADLVIADVLVPEEIVNMCTGRVVRSRKTKGSAHSAQDELNEWMVEGARKGLYVCRLKGGDPFLFGRATEEIQYVLDHGFSVKVIPGISSSMCSSLSSGIPITSRGVANQICIATGHGRDDSFPNLPAYKEKSSYVFLMGMSRLKMLSKTLVKMGFPGRFPVTIIEKATTADQRVVKGTLNDIFEIAQEQNIKSPATIVMGPVVESISWNQNTLVEYMSGGVYYYMKIARS